MQRRINGSLSEEAVRILDRMAPKGDRSCFLDDLGSGRLATARPFVPA